MRLMEDSSAPDLLERIEDAILRFERDGDDSGVLDDALLGQALDLLNDPDGVTLRALGATARLEWHRHRIEGAEGVAPDHVVEAFRMMAERSPELVPAALRPTFGVSDEDADPTVGAAALMYGARRRGDADLEAAITVLRQRLATVPKYLAARAEYLGFIADGLVTRHGRRGAIADLYEAIELTRQAIDLAGPGSPHRAIYLSNLAICAQIRFRAVGNRDDIDLAIDAGREALAAAPDGYRDHRKTSTILADCLLERFDLTSRSC
ncbi:hypothetical protein AB0J68_16395 [Micromonospora sp. NPDC049580]|uniref:hypothetical protein n=1 Tax=Micromonospora sp. NPDC049580 TaxID=3154832 RepID=UPI0034214D25